jgi:hypothetical protein
MKHTPTLTFLRRASAIAIFAAIIGVSIAIAYQQNQQTQPQAEFPATPEGKLARALFEAFNSGDRAAIESFIKGNLSSRALQDDSAAEYVTQAYRLYTQSGGFELMQVLPERSGRGPRQFAPNAGTIGRIHNQLEKDEPGNSMAGAFAELPIPKPKRPTRGLLRK